MKKFVLLSALAAAALTTSACHRYVDTHDADVVAIQNTEAQWNQDYVAKDPDKLASHYAEDAVLMIPGQSSIYGRDAIRDSLKKMATDPAFTVQFHSLHIEVAKSSDIAYTQGAYTMTMTDPVSKALVNDHGSYVTGYRKTPDGQWKAVSDIATSDIPPSSAAIAAPAMMMKKMP